MSITGPGSITANTVLAQTNMMNQLTKLSTELGSGQAAQTYSDLASQAGLALSLNGQLSAINGYSSTANTVGTTLTLAQSVLTQLGDSSSAVIQSINQQPAFSLDSTGQTQVQEAAASQLAMIVDLLNTQAGNNYMFSGSALNQPSVASADTILNGSGAQAGLKQVITQRQAADLGNGLGRLVIPASSGSVLSIGEDVAGSPFGFKIAGVNSSLTGANVTGPSAPPATYSIDLGSTNPNPGDSIQFNLTLPDGSSQSITLQAVANGTTQLTSPNTVASLSTSGVVASVQSNVDLSSAGIAALATGDTINYTLGTTAVTATFGTTDSGNTFDDAAGLISVLNATTNFGAHGATALTDGAGGVALYSNDLSTDFTTTFTSTGLTATNLVTTAHSLGDALTLSDGTHSSTFYYVAQNAQAADGTFNTAANLVSALNNPATSTRTFIDGAAVGAGSAYLALSNFNGPITVGGAIGAALGFPTGAVDYNVNLPLRVSGPPATATALVAGTTANTVFWYTGESGTTPPRDTATAQVGPSISIAYGMRANEQALTTLISNVALLAATTYSPTDPNAATNYQALSQHVTANLSGQPGTQQISDIESDLANAQTTVKNASDLNTLTQTTLTNMLQTIDGVNQTQVGEQILTLQNNLSASMSVTARLAQISLVNYLAPVA